MLCILHCVRKKSNSLCTFFITRANYVDFNKILHQQCSIELQTNRKISVKYVHNCNSYSGDIFIVHYLGGYFFSGHSVLVQTR